MLKTSLWTKASIQLHYIKINKWLLQLFFLMCTTMFLTAIVYVICLFFLRNTFCIKTLHSLHVACLCFYVYTFGFYSKCEFNILDCKDRIKKWFDDFIVTKCFIWLNPISVQLVTCETIGLLLTLMVRALHKIHHIACSGKHLSRSSVAMGTESMCVCVEAQGRWCLCFYCNWRESILQNLLNAFLTHISPPHITE